MINDMPDFIRPGAVVKVNEWYGVVEDVAVGEKHVMVYVVSPKMVYRNQKGEWLDYTLNPNAWQAATSDDMRREIADYRKRITQKLVELDNLERP